MLRIAQRGVYDMEIANLGMWRFGRRIELEKLGKKRKTFEG